MMTVRIGTSGWNYPGGRGTWNGVFYPPAKGRPRTFDELTYYAEHFDTVEVNSTFYGQPREKVTQEWVRRTPPGFEFSLKLYQKFTHPGMYRTRLAKSLPPEASHAVMELAQPTAVDLDEFKRGIDPLSLNNRLGALIAQFPPSFKSGEREEQYLRQLLTALRDYPVAVELRHRSWSDHVADTLALLNEFGAAWAQIDEPKFKFSIEQNYLPNVKSFYYMRLHGRNAAQWWRHEHSEDRYNYLYSMGELEPFADIAKAASRLVKKVFLYTNNHFAAKSVANAAMLKRLIDQPVEGAYPQAFVQRYPELAGVVREGSFDFLDDADGAASEAKASRKS
jgi:uncharacterized protein YecE (DUF72 family)